MPRGANDGWCTPRWMTERLPEVDLDPCSNPQSTVQARCRISLETGGDGLAEPWGSIDYVSALDQERGWITASVPCHAFVNPPYSNPLPWVKRAVEFAANGGQCLMLVKLDPTTRWWAAAADSGASCCLFRKRFAFDGAPNVAPWPCAFVIFEPEDTPQASGHFWQFLTDMAADGWIW